MNPPLLLAEIGITAIASIGAVLVVIFMFFGIWASRYTKVGPNQVLIISGVQHKQTDPDGAVHSVGFRIVKGGGAFVLPVFEKVDILSLELLTIDVQTPEVYTSKGVPVKVDGVAQIKVKGDIYQFVPQPSNSSAKGPKISKTSPCKPSKAISAPSWER